MRLKQEMARANSECAALAQQVSKFHTLHVECYKFWQKHEATLSMAAAQSELDKLRSSHAKIIAAMEAEVNDNAQLRASNAILQTDSHKTGQQLVVLPLVFEDDRILRHFNVAGTDASQPRGTQN